jgi:hypothetical protein
MLGLDLVAYRTAAAAQGASLAEVDGLLQSAADWAGNRVLRIFGRSIEAYARRAGRSYET